MSRDAKYKLNYKFERKLHARLLKNPLPTEIKRLPTIFSLRDKMPPVQDQKSIGDCTCFAMSGALMFLQAKQNRPPEWTMLSHLFLYYNGRLLGGEALDSDSGLTVYDVCNSASKYGACSETLWPYLEANLFLQPPQECYTEAEKCKLAHFEQVQQKLENLQNVLASGFPILFGFLVYDSFYNAPHGEAQLPTQSDTLCGGHCVLLVGYDNEKRRFFCMNSWGTSWGDEGYFSLPYEYVLDENLCSDFYVVKKLVSK